MFIIIFRLDGGTKCLIITARSSLSFKSCRAPGAAGINKAEYLLAEK
jgi:hypothetical protein